MRVVLPKSGEIVLLQPTKALQSELDDWRKTDCHEHPETEWRRSRTASGGIEIRRQCLHCGHILGGARKKETSDENLPFVDRSAKDAFENSLNRAYQNLLIKHATLQKARETEWYREHNEYLSSKEWASRRQMVLTRCGGKCEGCGTQKATQVHHRTYEHWKNEFLFELVGVCQSCHEQLHEAEHEPLEEDFE